MPAYLIADIDVTDPAAYDEYKRRVPATVAEFGGRFIVRGGASETLEGDWRPTRVVVLEFPDMTRLKAWYNSSGYAPLITLRQAATEGDLIAVEGA